MDSEKNHKEKKPKKEAGMILHTPANEGNHEPPSIKDQVPPQLPLVRIEEPSQDSLQDSKNFPLLAKTPQDLCSNPKPKESRTCYVCNKYNKEYKARKCQSCKIWVHVECQPGPSDPTLKKYICSKCPQIKVQKPKNQRAQTNPQPDFKTPSKPIQQKKREKSKVRARKEQIFSKQSSTDELPSQQLSLRQRFLQQFEKDYPLYLSEKKQMLYPIKDQLFQVYKEIFPPSKQLSQVFHKTEIPCQSMGDMLLIENICYILRHSMKIPVSMSIEEMYKQLSGQKCDRCFNSIVSPLLSLYLSDIFSKKTEHGKFVSSNLLLELIRYGQGKMDIKLITSTMWASVVHTLSKSPHLQSRLSHFSVIPTPITCSWKIQLLVKLIQGLIDNETFRNLISKVEAKQDGKEKQKLMDQVQQIQCSIQDFNEMISHSNKQIEMIDARMLKGLKKEEIAKLTNSKEQLLKMVGEMQQERKGLKESEISNQMRLYEMQRENIFSMGSLQLLGKDRNESEYYLHFKESNRIYVNYRAQGLQDETVFKVIQGVDQIKELAASLNLNGVRERGLHEQITFHLEYGIICESLTPLSTPEPDIILEAPMRVGLQDVYDILLLVESKLSDYFASAGLEWGTKTQRENFRRAIQANPKGGEILFMKESIRVIYQKSKLVYNTKSEDRELEKKRIIIWSRMNKNIKSTWMGYLQNTTTVEQGWFCSRILQAAVQDYIQRRKGQSEENPKKRVGRPPKILEELCLNKPMKQQEEESESEYLSSLRFQKRKRERKNKGKGKYGKEMDDGSDENLLFIPGPADVCHTCKQYGELLCCDVCPLMFHLECLEMKHVPRGKWICGVCKEKISFLQAE